MSYNKSQMINILNKKVHDFICTAGRIYFLPEHNWVSWQFLNRNCSKRKVWTFSHMKRPRKTTYKRWRIAKTSTLLAPRIAFTLILFQIIWAGFQGTKKKDASLSVIFSGSSVPSKLRTWFTMEIVPTEDFQTENLVSFWVSKGRLSHSFCSTFFKLRLPRSLDLGW